MECRGRLLFPLSHSPVGAGESNPFSGSRHDTRCSTSWDPWVAQRAPLPIHWPDRTLASQVWIPNPLALVQPLLLFTRRTAEPAKDSGARGRHEPTSICFRARTACHLKELSVIVCGRVNSVGGNGQPRFTLRIRRTHTSPETNNP